MLVRRCQFWLVSVLVVVDLRVVVVWTWVWVELRLFAVMFEKWVMVEV